MNITLTTVFDEQNQDRPYRNEIAADLNLCIAEAEDAEWLGLCDHSEAILRTVQRVAEFENIKVKK